MPTFSQRLRRASEQQQKARSNCLWLNIVAKNDITAIIKSWTHVEMKKNIQEINKNQGLMTCNNKALVPKIGDSEMITSTIVK